VLGVIAGTGRKHHEPYRLPGAKGPAARRSINGDRGPAASVFFAEVDEQRVVIVLDPETMTRVGLLVKFAGDAARGGSLVTKDVHRLRRAAARPVSSSDATS